MATLRSEIASLFPEGVMGQELSAPEEAEPLFEAEQGALARAVQKRRNEFALGRTAARRAMEALGVPRVALLPNEDRSVAWPESVWGSISHADGLCIAVVGLRSALRGIGVDVEVKDRVEPKLWRMIATEREQAYLAEGEDERARLERATRLFSAKEAFYKAQYCITKSWVGFHDAETSFDRPGEFRLTLLKDIAGFFSAGSEFEGRYVCLEQHVVTALAILPR